MIDLSNVPSQIVLKNVSAKDQKLNVEGRSLVLHKGQSVKVKASTSGQILDYYGQESNDLKIVENKDPIVYIKQIINEDGSCNLELSTEVKNGQPYVCTQLMNGTLVFATAAGDLGEVDKLRSVSGVYFNGTYMRITPTGTATNKIAGTINKTVAVLTADDLRGLVTIPQQWQMNNTYLTKLEIPNSVTSIGKEAFKDCTSLREVTFEQNSLCKYIYTYAFNNCNTNLKKIEFPDSLETISDNCLWATNVEYIGFGSGIKTIGKTITNSTLLKTIVLNKQCITEADVPALGSKFPSGIVYVPDETTQTLLQNTSPWNQSTIKLMSELPEEVV